MCQQIGVDPLHSGKSFWAEVLGTGNNDFWYELGVQVVEQCLGQGNSVESGGLVSVDMIKERISQRRSSRTQTVKISNEEIIRAVDTLRPLHPGYKIIKVEGDKLFIQSVPMEVSPDQMVLIGAASAFNGCITEETIRSNLGWSMDRYVRAIDALMMEGLIWMDKQHSSGKTAYWLPSLAACFR